MTDSNDWIRTLKIGDERYEYVSLKAAAPLIGDMARKPASLKILVENLLRFHDGSAANLETIRNVARGTATGTEIAFRPARILSQDLAGVPLIVDLASLRDGVKKLGGDPESVNPVIPVDFVVDHSIVVDSYASAGSLRANMQTELMRNAERFEFLRWASHAFRNVRIVPPGKGICHQVNLEYFSEVVSVAQRSGREDLLIPDTVLGTDSHTTMVNGLGVLGWGAGGTEAELAMLGEPVSMLAPEIVGVRLTGRPSEGVAPTDLVLAVTETLRRVGVVDKFVEFFGPGVSSLSVADRATIANMAPDYGATCGFFGICQATLDYLRLTGRAPNLIARVEAYAKAQELWSAPDMPEPEFAHVIEIDLAEIAPSLAGPDRPEQRLALRDAPASLDVATPKRAALGDQTGATIGDGDIVIAAITSCTNTSNPRAMIGAGLLAKKARIAGLSAHPRVKTSFGPGSQVVSDYLERAGLQEPLDELGFNVVGYGCTTCIGNSGALQPALSATVRERKLKTVAVLSGNRNFQGRVNPDVGASYLASPQLVVAYAIAGSILTSLDTEPLGYGKNGLPVYLNDVWPSAAEIDACIAGNISAELFRERYAHVTEGDPGWNALGGGGAQTFPWSEASLYISDPHYFDAVPRAPEPPRDIFGARVLLQVGNSFTTDHISPAGAISPRSPAGVYLATRGVQQADYNTYGARRGHYDIMVRGAFSNARIRNELAPDLPGGETMHAPSGDRLSIYDAAMRYRDEGVPLVIVGGKEYGTGSSRDWASKATRALGVRAVIAESFERIHRANLVGAAVLPLQLRGSRTDLALTGGETFEITGLATLQPRQRLTITMTRSDGARVPLSVDVRIDTDVEWEYFRHGGLLPYMLRKCLD